MYVDSLMYGITDTLIPFGHVSMQSAPRSAVLRDFFPYGLQTVAVLLHIYICRLLARAALCDLVWLVSSGT